MSAARRSSRRRRRRFKRLMFVALLAAVLGGSYWYVHQPEEWQAAKRERWGPHITGTIERIGYGVADFTDDLGITGEDVRVSVAAREQTLQSPHYAGPPRDPKTEQIAGQHLVSTGFDVGYSDTRRDPLWAAYRLFRVSDLVPPPRPSRFTTDGRTMARVKPDDYSGSGYDRGHMAPNFAIATRYGRDAQRESFRMSNICPQRPGLNRHCWRLLEHRLAARYGQTEGDVWVIVGPVFDQPSPETLPEGVAIPDAFFMVAVNEDEDQLRAFAVIIPQGIRKGQSASRFLTSIDEVERRTGLDVLCELPDDVEKAIESPAATRLWPSLIPMLQDRFRSWFPGKGK